MLYYLIVEACLLTLTNGLTLAIRRSAPFLPYLRYHDRLILTYSHRKKRITPNRSQLRDRLIGQVGKPFSDY